MAKKAKPRRRGRASARGRAKTSASNNGKAGAAETQVEVTLFTSEAGPLSKHIGLAADGTLVNDSSARLTRGTAERCTLTGLDDLAALLKDCTSYNALALGVMQADGDKVPIVTTDALKDNPGAIARSRKYFEFREGQPAYVLLDFDRKGMPPTVADRIKTLGGFWEALCTVCPALRGVAHLTRASTSAGLSRSDTGQAYPNSGGLHGYIIACNGNDSERFLKDLHQRCWLAGLGWMMPDRTGKALERSIVDRSVGLPERLVFEGPPVLDPPLGQDTTSREPEVTKGVLLVDTLAACPPLTADEQKRLRKLQAKDGKRIAPDCEAARDRRIQELMKERGLTKEAAARIILAQHAGTLQPDDVLAFFDPDLGDCTVTDVLNDPERFIGRTLADPVEGIAYGRQTAKVLRREDGTLFINSFAHGGIQYELSSSDEYGGVSLEDFYAYMPKHDYIFTPTGEHWPAVSVNARIVGKANAWLDKNRSVEQQTWVPGMPMLIQNRLVTDGGWVEREGNNCFNLYRPPTLVPGDASRQSHGLIMYTTSMMRLMGTTASIGLRIGYSVLVIKSITHLCSGATNMGSARTHCLNRSSAPSDHGISMRFHLRKCWGVLDLFTNL